MYDVPKDLESKFRDLSKAETSHLITSSLTSYRTVESLLALCLDIRLNQGVAVQATPSQLPVKEKKLEPVRQQPQSTSLTNDSDIDLMSDLFIK